MGGRREIRTEKVSAEMSVGLSEKMGAFPPETQPGRDNLLYLKGNREEGTGNRAEGKRGEEGTDGDILASY